jgi:hypothetical protein
MRSSILGLGALFLLSACASAPAPVRLTADPEGRALLAGKWSGPYYTSDGGRSGSIELWFNQRDTTGVECRGDVVMVPRNQGEATLTYDQGGISAPEETIRVLSIETLRVTGHDVYGIITPYQDPETGEMLSTTFEGKISGDRISGSLVTIHARSGDRAEGTWEVTRAPN